HYSLATISEDEHEVIWEIFWDNLGSVLVRRAWIAASAIVLGDIRTRYNQILASRAFTCGDRVFVHTAQLSSLQATWFLLDEGLLPVGHLDFGVADTSSYADGRLAGINYTGDVGYEFHTALNYKIRVTQKDSTYATSGIYTEASIKGVYLNFLPALHSAPAGRCTYIAGAQLWCYDGQALTEAGFHLG